jgi:hypothetical protein
MTFATDYAEQGYDAPKRGILFANWNMLSKKAGELLERMGYSLEWSDEWVTCEDCNKAVRCSPDSYDWQQSYVQQDDNIVCRECCNKAQYLEEVCEDNQRACCPDWIDPSTLGYKLISEPREYESGFHEGMNADPSKILAQLAALGHKRIVFRLAEKSQFYVKFEAWEKVEEEEEA